MTEISFTFDDTEVVKKLADISSGISNFREPLNDAGSQLLSFYSKDVFGSQGLAAGESWRQLSASTLKMRANRTGYYKQTPIVLNKILIWTGRLQRGFKKTVKSTKLIIENTVEYFKHHQGNRKMLTINSKVIIIVVNSVNDYLRKIILK